jgi:hypothetical protein
MGIFRITLTAGISLGLLHSLAAQPNPADGDRAPKRLAGTPAEFPGVFSVIRAVMALPDGRLVVSDPEENRILLIDFPKGTSLELARTGAGPREYRKAGGLYRARGGGVLLFDQGLRRLLPVSPSGEVQDILALPVPGSSSSSSNRGPDPYASDSLGNAYGAIRFGRDMNAPTFPLVRYVRGARPDTVARLLKAPSKVIEATANSTRSQEGVFAPQDAWVVAPDGRIGVVGAAPYRVEWIPLSGSVVTGPTISYKAVVVTQADKDAAASGAGALGGKQNVNLGIGPAGAPPPPAGAGDPAARKELLFADVKSPVRIGFGHWPLLDESGRLWVERSLPASSKTTVFDVFDRAGNLAERIEIPSGSRLIGFDARWLYTVRVDADDFEHLQRFPLPR